MPWNAKPAWQLSPPAGVRDDTPLGTQTNPAEPGFTTPGLPQVEHTHVRERGSNEKTGSAHSPRLSTLQCGETGL